MSLRKQKGWSQERLAQESGISYNTLIKLERKGIKNPTIETVVRLADALDVSLDELVGRQRPGLCEDFLAAASAGVGPDFLHLQHG